MSWTYNFTTNPQIAYVRLLIPDREQATANFADEEITAFYFIQANQFQSSQFYSANAGAYLPSSPVSYLRVAALAISILASSGAAVAFVKKVLDVDLDALGASKALRDMADSYRCIDDDAGAFAIIEQVSSVWAFKDRWWNQFQRMSGG